MRSNVATIWQREMLACFLSPVAYVTMVVFLAVTGMTFLQGASRNVGSPEPLSLFLYGAVCIWLPVLITVISMRLFAEEKRSGTIETLLTAPVTETDVVVGKYLGALSFVILLVLPGIMDVVLIERMSPAMDSSSIDRGALAAGGLIVVLVSALSLAFGLLVSIMTANQIIAAITTFCGVWILMIGGWLLRSLPGFPPSVAEYFSVIQHIEDFSRGSVEARALVPYVTGTGMLLFWAVKALESRRWR